MFQDGSNEEPTGQRPERADAEASRRRALPATIEEMTFHECIVSSSFGRPLIHADPRPESISGLARRRFTSDRSTSPAPIRFPPNNFNLGQNSPPDLGCIPKQPDLWIVPYGVTGSGHNGALTLSGTPFQGT
ncbi:hypothetical protein BC332_33874 [Capsicum chinense]|nr:hypothetical protein BC332_33874 [Capsicum chinense]